jgi:hypothetical protein
MTEEMRIRKSAQVAAKWWADCLTGENKMFRDEYINTVVEIFKEMDPAGYQFFLDKNIDVVKKFKEEINSRIVPKEQAKIFEESLFRQIVKQFGERKISYLYTDPDICCGPLSAAARESGIDLSKHDLFPPNTEMFVDAKGVEIRFEGDETTSSVVFNVNEFEQMQKFQQAQNKKEGK